MRNLFDTKKEHKSIKLVKKLQEEADKEWEREVQRRKEQELNDEAIAKELQTQLEEEQRQQSSTSPISTVIRSDSNPFLSTSSSPPPLPTKPRAYHSSNNATGGSNNHNHIKNSSTNSLPANKHTISIKPLYGLTSASSSSSSARPTLPPRQKQEDKKPVKSYLNNAKRYQPELQFALASPAPEPSSVFYSKTPTIRPLPGLNSHQFTTNTPSSPITMQPLRPTTAPPTVINTNTSTSEPTRNHMPMPAPIDVTPTSYKPITANNSNNTNSAPSSYNNKNHPTLNTTTVQPTAPPPFSPQKTDPIVLPLAQPTTSSYNNQHQTHNEPPPYFPNNNSNYNKTSATAPYYHQQMRQDNASPAVSLPLNPNNIVQNASTFQPQHYQQQQQQQHSYPISTGSSSSGFQLPRVPVFVTSSSSASTNQPSAMPLNKQEQQQLQHKPNNPYIQKKPLFSNSVLTLKPDEDQPKQSNDEDEDDDDWDNAPVITSPIKNRVPTTVPAAAVVESDDESELDYSDMIYDRRNESNEEKSENNHTEKQVEEEEEEEDEEDTWVDPAVDPFADSFAVHVSKASTATSATVIGDHKSFKDTSSASIQILDPTLAAISRKKSTNKVALENELKKEDKVAEEVASDAVPNGLHYYEEKESEEVEVRPPRPQSSLGSFLSPADRANTPRPVYQHQHASPALFYNQAQVQQTPVIDFDLLGDEDQLKVYPTNILKAGAPPQMSATNPYNKKQNAVPASDYGYYQDGSDPLKSKSLPKLPNSDAATLAKKGEAQDRHITVASINPDQRVWIRIHPTDTGKLLAERIHIVASYQTRRVTKITTKNGRNIPLDNSPLFDDWNEILSFKEGESWTVDWVPVESPYVDIITDTKEFMKQLKANFRGTSSSSAAAS